MPMANAKQHLPNPISVSAPSFAPNGQHKINSFGNPINAYGNNGNNGLLPNASANNTFAAAARQKAGWNSNTSNGWSDASRPGTAETQQRASGTRLVGNAPNVAMHGAVVGNRKISYDDERRVTPALLNGASTVEVGELERKLAIVVSERDQAVAHVEAAQAALKREQQTVEMQRQRIEGLEAQLADTRLRNNEAQEIKLNLHETETSYREQAKQNEMLLDLLAQQAAKNFEFS